MIKWYKIKSVELSFSLFHDLMMVLLVLLNFIFVFFDSLFKTGAFRDFIIAINSDFYYFYLHTIHEDFVFYDLLFVGFFIFEFSVRWLIAIYKKEFVRWYYFPFVFWYDLLGCIPIGSFRAFRLLRLVTMALKLHKIGVIDIKENFLYKFLARYFNIFVEEVSNRVVVNVISGLQKEVKSGTPVADKIVANVIIPHKEFLVTWVSQKLQHVTADTYEQHREEIELYSKELVLEAMENNQELKNLEMIPFVGSKIAKDIERATSDITYRVLNNLIRDIASDNNNNTIKEMTEIAFDSVLIEKGDQKLNEITLSIVDNALDVIKQEVKKKRFKVRRV